MIQGFKAMAYQRDESKQRKQQIRVHARAARKQQEHRGALSRQICRKLADLPEYVNAGVVMFYVDMPFEVDTRHFLPAAWTSGKQIVVPYCIEGQLDLFRIESFDDLAPGTYGILEPTAECRRRQDRNVDISEVDLVVLPGVAFDRRGGRIGHGKGYYDKLLRHARSDTALVALAFECQLVDEVPMLPYDVLVHAVITEKAIYGSAPRGRGG